MKHEYTVPFFPRNNKNLWSIFLDFGRRRGGFIFLLYMQDYPCLVLKENLKVSEFYVSLEISLEGLERN